MPLPSLFSFRSRAVVVVIMTIIHSTSTCSPLFLMSFPQIIHPFLNHYSFLAHSLVIFPLEIHVPLYIHSWYCFSLANALFSVLNFSLFGYTFVREAMWVLDSCSYAVASKESIYYLWGLYTPSTSRFHMDYFLAESHFPIPYPPWIPYGIYVEWC